MIGQEGLGVERRVCQWIHHALVERVVVAQQMPAWAVCLDAGAVFKPKDGLDLTKSGRVDGV